MNYAKELIRYRAKHDLSQTEMGKLLKVTRETVGLIERGRQTGISARLKAKIEMLVEKDTRW